MASTHMGDGKVKRLSLRFQALVNVLLSTDNNKIWKSVGCRDMRKTTGSGLCMLKCRACVTSRHEREWTTDGQYKALRTALSLGDRFQGSSADTKVLWCSSPMWNTAQHLHVISHRLSYT